MLFVAASHQTGLDTRSKARRPIKVGKNGRGRSGTSRDSNPAGLCCSLTHEVQCGSNEPSSFTNPDLGPGTDAGFIALTRQQGLVLYIGDRSVNVAAHPPKGGPAETGGLSASNLQLISISHPART